MTDREWADTPEGVAAFEWVENYVDEVLQALDDGNHFYDDIVVIISVATQIGSTTCA